MLSAHEMIHFSEVRERVGGHFIAVADYTLIDHVVTTAVLVFLQSKLLSSVKDGLGEKGCTVI